MRLDELGRLYVRLLKGEAPDRTFAHSGKQWSLPGARDRRGREPRGSTGEKVEAQSLDEALEDLGD